MNKGVKAILLEMGGDNQEAAFPLELEGLGRADLAGRFGCSRARVTRKLNLLNLPMGLLQEIESMGDYWERRLVTERGLRGHR